MSLKEDGLRERWFPSLIPRGKEDRIKQDTVALEAFVREACKTSDEHDSENRIKPLPLDELEYLRYYFATLLRERTIIAPKSRQIMITWATYCYVLWRLMRYRGEKWALVPKKEEAGKHHVDERIRYCLWANMPEWLRAEYEVESVKGTFHLTHRKGQIWRAQLLVYPQGAEQLRGEAHSGVVWDEAFHQPKFRAAYKGAIPTLQGRKGLSGQIIIISSVAPNHYVEKLCGARIREAIKECRGEAA